MADQVFVRVADDIDVADARRPQIQLRVGKSSSRLFRRRFRSLVSPSCDSELKSMLRNTFSSLALLASSIFSSAMLISSPMLAVSR